MFFRKQKPTEPLLKRFRNGNLRMSGKLLHERERLRAEITRLEAELTDVNMCLLATQAALAELPKEIEHGPK